MSELSEEIQPQSASERSPSGGLFGVATGIVSDNQDPNGMGRVKVRLPWLGDDMETFWLPVMTWMGGNDSGVSFIPEPDDMVLVGFEHGDLNHGFVLGIVRNSQQPPPYDNEDGGNHTRIVRSRSGHELRFLDDADQRSELVSLKSSGGHEVVLDDSQGSTVIRVRSAGGHEILMDDGQGQAKIQLTDGQGNEVTLSATDGVSLKAAVKISIEAPQIDIAADTVLALTGNPVKLN